MEPHDIAPYDALIAKWDERWRWVDAMTKFAIARARAGKRDRDLGGVELWPLARVLAEVQCGSGDWSWLEEWFKIDSDDEHAEEYAELQEEIRRDGMHTPVLIGNDGRLWDGHHRLRIAVRLGIAYVPVELTPSAP